MNKRINFGREIIAEPTDNVQISWSPENSALVWNVILENKTVLPKLCKNTYLRGENIIQADLPKE